MKSKGVRAEAMVSRNALIGKETRLQDASLARPYACRIHDEVTSDHGKATRGAAGSGEGGEHPVHNLGGVGSVVVGFAPRPYTAMSATEECRSLTGVGRAARAVALVLLGYWGVYAVATPVTNYDSHTYNIARLALAEQGGFFGNTCWTSVWQLMHPWSFDAVHLPFLRLDAGYAVPSFLCFVGLCVIVFRMVRSAVGVDAAWSAVLGLLALPCLVYQATSTKNDVAVVFFLAVWVYAYWRWRSEGRRGHLFWMVLAIGCLAGAKVTGLMYAAACLLWSAWAMRRDLKVVAAVMSGATLSLVLFGSVETYVECQRVFGHPLGPEQLVRRVVNRDGWRGGLANLSRYAAGSLYVGQSEWSFSTRAIRTVVEAERGVLRWCNLADAGTSVGCPDRKLFFVQSGLEELSGFGPLGTVGLGILVAALLRWRPRERWWRCAIGAFVGFVLVSLTVGFMVWNNRYLVGHFALTTVATVILLWGHGGRFRDWLRRGFVVLAALCAVAVPLVSFNRTPASLVRAVVERDAFETCNAPEIGNARTVLRELRAVLPNCRIAVGVSKDSPVLPYLKDKRLNTMFFVESTLPALVSAGVFRPGDLVVVDDAIVLPELERVAEVSAPNVFCSATYGQFALMHRYIYRYRAD